MVEQMVNFYTDGNKAKFAKFLGVSPQTISAWVARGTFDAELIYSKCYGISAEWLLTGRGPMFSRARNGESNNPLPERPDYSGMMAAEPMPDYNPPRPPKEISINTNNTRLSNDLESIDDLEREIMEMRIKLHYIKNSIKNMIASEQQ